MPDLTVWPTDGADGSVSSEARWRKMARLWVPSGIDDTPLGVAGGGGALAPTLVAGPTINVAAGGCWMDGHYAEIVTPSSVPATANGLLVVRFTPADNHAELLYRDAATQPTQTLATWELPIAQMAAGALTDRRVAASLGGPPIVTAFPAFPYDGQTVRYWFAAENLLWTFTYVAAAPSPHRWCFVGGPAIYKMIPNADQQAAGGSWGNLATLGPDTTLPLAGIYNAEYGFKANGVIAGAVMQVGPVTPGTSTPFGIAIVQNSGAGAANGGWNVAGAAQLTIPAQGVSRMLYQSSGANVGFFSGRWQLFTPVRCS